MFGIGGKDKKPKSKARKIIDWIVTGVFATLAVGLTTMFIISKTSKNPNVFGTTYQRVLTDSMSPTYKVKDIIVLTKANPADLVKRVEEGKNVDVSFHWSIKGTDVSMTHRLISATYSPEEQIDPITGTSYHYTFVAHGINTRSEWCKSYGEYQDCTGQTQTFHETALIGRVTRVSWFMTFVTSVWGLLIVLLVPCMYLITSSVFDICKALDDKDEENGEITPEQPKSNDPLAGLSEKEKERLKKQMLDEMLNKK